VIGSDDLSKEKERPEGGLKKKIAILPGESGAIPRREKLPRRNPNFLQPGHFNPVDIFLKEKIELRGRGKPFQEEKTRNGATPSGGNKASEPQLQGETLFVGGH